MDDLMPLDHWAVTVSRNGEEIVTIESDCLCGRDISPEDERAIKTAALNLLGFIGVPPPDERARCLAKVAETASYYSTNIFSDVSKEETDLIHREYPGLIDRLSASMARLCCRNITRSIAKEDDSYR